MAEVLRTTQHSARDASEGREPELDFTPREDSYSYITQRNERCLLDGIDLHRLACPDANPDY